MSNHPWCFVVLSMEYQQRENRHQLALYTTCLDDRIQQHSAVRFIDEFVESLNLHDMGFESLPAQGRPPYNPAYLLKLYIYGYMNRMRSSRQLEKELSKAIS